MMQRNEQELTKTEWFQLIILILLATVIITIPIGLLVWGFAYSIFDNQLISVAHPIGFIGLALVVEVILLGAAGLLD
ncbi:MAG: hypothetical protein V3T23_01705 [Nitrososphaerales archaeon]